MVLLIFSSASLDDADLVYSLVSCPCLVKR